MKKIRLEIKKAYSCFLLQKRLLRVEHDGDDFIVLYAKMPTEKRVMSRRSWAAQDWEMIEAFVKKSRKS